MQPNQQADDKAIFDSLQGKDASFFDSLQEDEAAQLQVAVDRHKQRMSAAPQPISQQNVSKLQNNPDWVTQDQLSGQDTNKNIRAAAQTATAGLAPRLMDEFQAAKGAIQQGRGQDYLHDVLKPYGPDTVQRIPVGTQYRDMYKNAADQVMPARVAGSFMNPLNQVTGGAATQFLGGAASQGIQQASAGGDVNNTDMAVSGAINAAFPQIMKAGGSVLDWASAKMAPMALNIVKDTAKKILESRASMTGQALQNYTRQGTSKMGFKTMLDDILYTVIDKIDPQIFQRQATRTGNIQAAVKVAGEQLGQSASKIDAATVPAGRLWMQLDNLADDTMRSIDPNITSGVPASKVIRQEFAAQPKNVNSQTEYPLGQLRRKISQVNDTQYQKAALPSVPQKAVQQGTGQVKGFLAQASGMTPDQSAAYKAADQAFQRTKKTSDIYFDSAAKADASATLDRSLGGIAMNEFIKPVRNKAAQVVHSTAKTAAQAAMNRLQKRFGSGGYSNMSPFQVDSIMSKLKVIAQMQPAESAAYVYAQSMVNPAFRAIWNQRDKQE